MLQEFFLSQTYSYPEMYWFESYEEKKSNAIETFNMAISNNYGSYIFINSLSGYIAETASSPTYSLVPSVGSAYGGDGGNIKALADKLNPDFYKHVYNAGMDQTTGPTGIVMMDYVSDTPDENVEFDGSYRLPGLIISNNRKFGTGNSSSGGNTGGGSVTPPAAEMETTTLKRQVAVTTSVAMKECKTWTPCADWPRGFLTNNVCVKAKNYNY